MLLEQVWGYRHAGDTRLVNVHVQRLRSKIEHDPERPEIVVTVRGVGYKAGPVLAMDGSARPQRSPTQRLLDSRVPALRGAQDVWRGGRQLGLRALRALARTW